MQVNIPYMDAMSYVYCKSQTSTECQGSCGKIGISSSGEIIATENTSFHPKK